MTKGKAAPAWSPPAAVAGAGVVYSLVATRFVPFTDAMGVATALPFVVVLAGAARNRWHRWRLPHGGAVERARVGGLLVWTGLLLGAGTFQLALYVSAPRTTYPTLSSLASIAFGWPVLRPLAFAAWLWLGWYLVER